jgi:hypothetical protein
LYSNSRAEDFDSEGGGSSEADDEDDDPPEAIPLQKLTQAKAKVRTLSLLCILAKYLDCGIPHYTNTIVISYSVA